MTTEASSRPATGRLARITLAVLHALVALTALAGGLTLIYGALFGDPTGLLVPPVEYLEGSPFPDFVGPGLLLAGVVGGTQVLASILAFRGRAYWQVGSAVASFGLAIWVFVQMIFIPFSFLQAVYMGFALGEIGLLLLSYGILSRPRR